MYKKRDDAHMTYVEKGRGGVLVAFNEGGVEIPGATVGKKRADEKYPVTFPINGGEKTRTKIARYGAKKVPEDIPIGTTLGVDGRRASRPADDKYYQLAKRYLPKG